MKKSKSSKSPARRIRRKATPVPKTAGAANAKKVPSPLNVFDLTGSSCLTDDDGEPLPTHLGKRNYVFHAGDSNSIGVGAVFRVSADSKPEALERVRAVANAYFDGTHLIRAAGFLTDNPWLDSVRIYLDGACIHLRHGYESEF